MHINVQKVSIGFNRRQKRSQADYSSSLTADTSNGPGKEKNLLRLVFKFSFAKDRPT